MNLLIFIYIRIRYDYCYCCRVVAFIVAVVVSKILVCIISRFLTKIKTHTSERFFSYLLSSSSTRLCLWLLLLLVCRMGTSSSKLNFRKAVIQLTAHKHKAIDDNDDDFWSQFWSTSTTSIEDIYTLIPAFEIRAVREEAPTNLAALCYKICFKIKECAESASLAGFVSDKNQIAGICTHTISRKNIYFRVFECNMYAL